MTWTNNAPFGTAVLLILGSGLIFPGTTDATAQHGHVSSVNPDTLKWGPAPPALPKGGQIAVLAGDPTKPGPFTVRLKFPAGFKIPAHSHPSFEAVTVISGSLTFGTGDKLDESKGEKLTAGSFIHLPENMNHYVFSTAESIVQINSVGPFDVKYANPGDDPRKTQ